VRFYDDAGNRMTARSTGQTSKAAAETWSYEQLKHGIISTEKTLLLAGLRKTFGYGINTLNIIL